MKCSVQGCSRDVHAKGLCYAHYQKQHYATHPDAYLRKLAANARWHDDPDNHNRVLETSKQWYARKRASKAVLRLSAKRAYYRRPTTLEREVARHLAKGRSSAAIAVWTDQPMSVILPIVAKLRPSPLPLSPAPTPLGTSDVPGTPSP